MVPLIFTSGKSGSAFLSPDRKYSGFRHISVFIFFKTCILTKHAIIDTVSRKSRNTRRILHEPSRSMNYVSGNGPDVFQDSFSRLLSASGTDLDLPIIVNDQLPTDQITSQVTRLVRDGSSIYKSTEPELDDTHSVNLVIRRNSGVNPSSFERAATTSQTRSSQLPTIPSSTV